MRKFAALGRADLIRCLAAHYPLDQATTELLGFQKRKERQTSQRIAPQEIGTAVPGERAQSHPLRSEAEIVFPEERPRLKFQMPMRAETLVPEAPRHDRGDPISDAELAVDWSATGPPLTQLVRWARLAPFLRSRLGAVLPGTRLDLRRLVRRAGLEVPFTMMPRLPRVAWASQAVVLWDYTPEMFPFAQDVGWLLERLRRERGKHGLEIRILRQLPRRVDVAGIPPGVPVLALSAMGQFQRAEGTAKAWIALARRLAVMRQSFHALNPCPRQRWQPAVASAWPSAVWDRRPRLPRHGGLHASRPATIESASDSEDLLDLLAPASRIEPPLLREARLRLGHAADAGVEWDAWHHAGCWHAMDCFGFKPGDDYAARLERRNRFDRKVAILAREIGELIREHHETCSSVIAAEAELRICLAGTPNDETLGEVKDLLRRIVERLQLLAEQPGSSEGGRNGLPAWFPGMVDRLSPSMRAEETIRELIARGLALAHAFLETRHTLLPAGVDGEVFIRETRAIPVRLARPMDYRLGMRGAGMHLIPGSSSPGPDEKLLALLRVGSRPVHLTVSANRGESHRCQLASPPAPIVLPIPAAPVPFSIESDRQRLYIEPMQRPRWAERMWQDRFGFAAQFSVGNVPFILRWIPPGRFLMGSPEDEAGRNQDEGPQHEVTITRGFWMGETPVTQGQWRAVAEAEESQRLDFAPSYFSGSGSLPVETVSSHMSTDFCHLLDALLPNGPGFSLPTEAQWEYACRAGTQGAFHVEGSKCTEPEGGDPVLNELGWYEENSERRTKEVKRKQPNGWGLYDMHGNVWEWCRDAWSDYKPELQIDPFRNGGEYTDRVIRGGSWSFLALHCRAACRIGANPRDRWFYRGLRLSAGRESSSAERHGSG